MRGSCFFETGYMQLLILLKNKSPLPSHCFMSLVGRTRAFYCEVYRVWVLLKGVDARDISVTIANCYVISKMSLFVLFFFPFHIVWLRRHWNIVKMTMMMKSLVYCAV